MGVPPPTRSEQLLLAYLQRSTRHPGVQTADAHVSLADLATQAGVGRESCRAALHALVASGSAKVAVHEGGLLEIRVQARCPADVASFGIGRPRRESPDLTLQAPPARSRAGQHQVAVDARAPGGPSRASVRF